MQIGTENRKKVMWAGSLGAVALIVILYQVLSSPNAPVTAAQPTSPLFGQHNLRHTVHAGKEHVVSESRLDPTLDLKLLAETEGIKYAGTGRNIFVAQAEVIPPPPPPIPLKFFGFANKPGEPKKAFLSQGEDVFIAVEGDIVDRRYKIIKIGPMSVEIEDVLYNNRQSIPLTQVPQG